MVLPALLPRKMTAPKGDSPLKAGQTGAMSNLTWHAPAVTRALREKKNGHRGAVVWLTGLPAAGKSTIAHAVEQRLHNLAFQAMVLDGDNIRHGLCADLGFSIADRNENVRRTGEVAKLLLEHGMIVLVALVSPVRSAREKVRESVPAGDFLEIYCDCPLAICRGRDPKGLYERAQSGTIPEYTGVSSPYEAPLRPALILDTGGESADESVDRLLQFLLGKLRHVDST